MASRRPRWTDRLLTTVVRLACREPMWTVMVAVVLAVACVALAAFRLEMKTSRLDLISPDREYNQRWLAYMEEFGTDDDVVFVCQGTAEQLPAVVAEIARRLTDEPNVDIPLWMIDPTVWSGPQSLTIQQLNSSLAWLRRFDVGDVASWAQLSSSDKLAQLVFESAEASPAELNLFADQLAASLETPKSPQFPFAINVERRSRHLLVNETGDQTLVLARVRRDENGGFAGGEQTFDRLKRIARDTANAFSHADTPAPGGRQSVTIGVTGIPVLEHDEMSTGRADRLRASVVGLLLLASLLVIAFGQWRLPLTAVSCLALGMAWTMGDITLTMGHLNLLSVAFGAILFGLGIDFTIHLATAFQAEQSTGLGTQASIEAAVSRTGVGILAGGLASALAFATAALTPFRGVAELGLVTGGGVFLCVAGALVVLPAMLCLAFRHPRPQSPPPVVLPIGRIVEATNRYPQTVLIISLVLMAVAGSQALKVRYDHNPLHLQAPEVESVRWELALVENGSRGLRFAVSMTDSTETLLRRKQRFMSLKEVETVEEFVSPFVVSPTHRLGVDELRKCLHSLPADQIQLAAPPNENWQRLQQTVERALEQLPAPSHQQILRDLQRKLQNYDPIDGPRRLATVEAAWRKRLWKDLSLLKSIISRPFTSENDLPAELHERFFSRGGKRLLRIYPRGDVGDLEQLQRFVRAVESVDGAVTGHPVQSYYASLEMQRSYVHAAVYAAVAVLIVLYLDFRALGPCLLAMLPMLMGLVQCFGILAACDIRLNAVNMIALPLILGIGINDGIHVLHDYRRSSADRTYSLGATTATAITITSAATMAVFGSMMLADHRGLRSLGQVVTLGIFCCWFCSLFLLPALLKLIRRPADG